MFSGRRYSDAKRDVYMRYMDLETSISDRSEYSALLADSLISAIFEVHYGSQNQISVVLNVKNSKAFVKDRVCSYHFK